MSASGYVYFMVHGGSDNTGAGMTKIGWARNPARRLKELQVGNPYRLRLEAVFAGSSLVENRVHRTLAPWRVRGEWFALAEFPDVAAEFVERGLTAEEAADAIRSALLARGLRDNEEVVMAGAAG